MMAFYAYVMCICLLLLSSEQDKKIRDLERRVAFISDVSSGASSTAPGYVVR